MPDIYGYETIRVNGKDVSAVPRRKPFYDSNFLLSTAAVPASLRYFQNNQQFSVSPVVLGGGNAKQQGRDTNVESNLGTVPAGSKYYLFGFRTAVEMTGLTMRGAAARGLAFYDDLRIIRSISHWEFRFTGGAEFFLRPWRDIALTVPHPIWAVTAGAESLLMASDEPGMLSLLIKDKPYELVAGEEFRMTQFFTLPTLPTPNNEMQISAIFECVQLVADKS